jgi:4a-hydroxytetrahydrobiopterin dehydratase
MKVLTSDEIRKRLQSLPGWAEGRHGIEKQYGLTDFRAAIRLVNQVAELAEQANHHPDILVEYDKVTLMLTTHDAGGITGRDFELAARIEALPR